MDGVVTRDDYDTRVGTVPGYALDPLKARILLSFALTKTRDHGAIEDIFKKYRCFFRVYAKNVKKIANYAYSAQRQ